MQDKNTQEELLGMTSRDMREASSILSDAFPLDLDLLIERNPELVEVFPYDLNLAELDDELVDLREAREYFSMGDALLTPWSYVIGAEAYSKGELIEGKELRLQSLTFFHVEPSDESTATRGGKLHGLSKMFASKWGKDKDGNDLICYMQSGFSPFSFALLKYGQVIKYYAEPCDHSTRVVVIEHEDDAERSIILDVLQNFLFELASKKALHYRLSSHFTVYDSSSEDSSSGEKIDVQTGFDLCQGESWRSDLDPMKLWLDGVLSESSYVSVLAYVRAIEFAAPTAASVELINSVQLMMKTQRHRIESAAFINELMAESKRLTLRNQKDAELIKLVVRSVVSPAVLAPLVGLFDTKLAEKLVSEERQKVEQAIDQYSEIVTDTRNSLVHAKSNYRRTGKELQEDQLGLLESSLRYVSHAAVLWYVGLPSSSKLN